MTFALQEVFNAAKCLPFQQNQIKPELQEPRFWHEAYNLYCRYYMCLTSATIIDSEAWYLTYWPSLSKQLPDKLF